MRIGTWNVNGIRARYDEVVAWAEEHRPDVFCLQEIKAAASQVPDGLFGLSEYTNYWHGDYGGYSGVSLHVRRSFDPHPTFSHPKFDVETRIVQARTGGVAVASVYVPNGNRDYAAKIRFLTAMLEWVTSYDAEEPLLICGDLNVTHRDIDVHETHRKRGAIGQRKEERDLLDQLMSQGLVDVLRASAPNDATLFTWWPPWRQEKARNRGWRIDYILADARLSAGVDNIQVLRDLGSSDHAPVLADVDHKRHSKR